MLCGRDQLRSDLVGDKRDRDDRLQRPANRKTCWWGDERSVRAQGGASRQSSIPHGIASTECVKTSGVSGRGGKLRKEGVREERESLRECVWTQPPGRKVASICRCEKG